MIISQFSNLSICNLVANYKIVPADGLPPPAFESEAFLIARLAAGFLIEGLKSHKVGAACLDVYEEEGDLFYEDCSEEIVADDTLVRLISMPNVIVTSHQAFLTEEALRGIAEGLPEMFPDWREPCHWHYHSFDFDLAFYISVVFMFRVCWNELFWRGDTPLYFRSVYLVKKLQ